MVRKAENGADMIERDKSKDVGALAELWPFMKPYKMLAGAAVLALMLTATVSLVLPVGGVPSLVALALSLALPAILVLNLWKPHANRSADLAS